MKKKRKNNIFKKILNGIKNFFLNIYNNFMKLKLVWRRVIILWLIILLIIILLIIFSAVNKKNNDKHKEIENALNVAVVDYVTDKGLYGTKDQKLRISIDELIDEEYFSADDLKDKTCTGYSLIYYENDAHHADSYLLCKNYTTDGYELKKSN